MAAPQDERVWIRIQAASGLLFSLFLTLHLSNTMAATAGEARFNAVQDGVRVVYQTPVLEILGVALPLLAHIIASAVRIVRRRRLGATGRTPWRLRLHRFTGWFLLAVIGGHVGATRVLPMAFDVSVRFGDLNLTTTLFGVPFSIYYILLGTAGTYHLANGLTVAARVFGVVLPRAAVRGPGFWGPVGAALVAVVLGVASISGWIFPVDPASWGPASELVADFLGSDLGEIAGGR